MHQVQDFIHVFEGLWDTPGSCRVRLYEEQGRPSVIICTAVPNNSETRVDTIAEWLAAEIWRRVGEPESFVWIEHFLSELSEDGSEQFHRVTFVRVPGIGGRFFSPHWESVSREAVEHLVDQAVD